MPLSTLLLGGCYAFEDTSPFILAVSHKTHHSNALDSTTQFPITISADHFHTIARQTVSHCSSDLYILVSQPGLHVTDLTGSTVPYLRKNVKNAESKITADYGHGIIDLEDISLLAQEKCHAEATFVDARHATFPAFQATNKTRVVTIEFDELPELLSRRKSHLSDNDAFLLSIMTSFPNSPNYTLIFTSSPSSHIQSHKRSAVFFRQDDTANSTAANSAGLFQHYQFFTPAIFMGLMAAVVLVPVLLVAVTVVSSLKIAPFELPKTQGAKKTQ